MIEKVGKTAKAGTKMSMKPETAMDSTERRSKCGNLVGDNRIAI